MSYKYDDLFSELEKSRHEFANAKDSKKLSKATGSNTTPDIGIAISGSSKVAKDIDDNRQTPQDLRQVRVDVVIVTALAVPEGKQVQAAFDCEWTDVYVGGVLYKVGDYSVAGRHRRIALTSPRLMGMVPTAACVSRAVLTLRPRVVAMTGICGGLRGKIELGDIVVAERVFDYGSGKITSDGHQPDFADAPMDGSLLQLVRNCTTNENLLSQIERAWSFPGRPKTRLSAHLGVVGSGAAVIASATALREIQVHQRKLIAVEMEAYGLMRAVEELHVPSVLSLVIKGVSDFADEEKNDSYQDYASFVSARFLRVLIDTHANEIWRDD